MEEEDLVFIENKFPALIVAPREPSNEPYRSKVINRSNANQTPPSTTRGPLLSIESPKDVATLPDTQKTMYISNHPTEALFERCQLGESPEDEIDLMLSLNKRRLPYISGPPVQTKPGLPGLEKHCPPLASTVSHL
jgi:hypothetical protein